MCPRFLEYWYFILLRITRRRKTLMHSKLFSGKALLVPSMFLLLLMACISTSFIRLAPAHAAANSTNAHLALGSGVSGVSVFVEPAAGETPILNAINNAQSSVYVELYLLTDTNVITALENAASNGLDVRVMLDPSPYGVGSSGPAATLATLSSYGVLTEDSSPAFTYTHEKGMIIDKKTVYIMTSNFTKSALGGSSSTTNREYGIIDSQSAEVKAALGVFNADWNRSSYTLTDTNIVLSPVNSLSDFLALINSAQSSLKIEAEEMDNSSVESAIVNAEARGVTVQVILPNGSTNASGITTLDDGGVSVYKDTQYYMHAKLILVDGTEAFVGSENISTTSLTKNRELGILISDTAVLAKLQSTFKSDLSNSTAA
jgi:cardiolipin synthase A/B